MSRIEHALKFILTPAHAASVQALRKKDSVRSKVYQKRRRRSDKGFSILLALRCRVGAAVRAQSARKFSRTTRLLGCTIQELMDHLEARFKAGMTWENHGKWHIDHIRPCALYDLRDPEQQRQCFHFTNLQPLWAMENWRKNKRYQEPSSTD